MVRCSLFAVGVLCLLLTNTARAQYVRVGPLGGVSIRGAQGAVDVLPLGLGTRVRGPHSSVDTGVYGLLAWPSTLHSSAFAPVDYSSSYGRYASGFNRAHAYPFIDTPLPPVVVVPVYVSPAVHAPVIQTPVIQTPVIARPVYAPPVFVEPYPASNYPELSYSEPLYSAPYEAASFEPVPASADFLADLSNMAMTSFEQVVDVPYEESVEDRLRSAAVRLRNSLSLRRDDSDVWLKYLGPDAIIEALDKGTEAKTFNEFLPNYQGVAGNAELTHIWSVDGFWQTHQAIRDWREPAEPTATDKSDSGDSVLEPKPKTPPLGDAEDLPVPTPEKAAPEATAPDTTAPGTTAPGTTAPGTGAPGATAPNADMPEPAGPEATAPETGAPDPFSPFALPPS